MRNYKFWIIFILCIFSMIAVFPQKSVVKKARALYDNGSWYEAIDKLKEAYNNVTEKSEKAEILYDLGECYRRVSEPLKAEIWYTKAENKNYSNPLLYFYLGQVKKMNQKYDEAIEDFTKYKDLVPDDPRGDDGLKSCEEAQKWINNPSGYIVENVKFINSKARDFSPAYARDDYNELYFTSYRQEAKGSKESGVTGESFGDIYLTKMDKKGSWSTPVPLGENVNSEFDEGTVSISHDFSTMYFTRCEVAKKASKPCRMYIVKKEGEDWGKAQMLKIAGDSITVGQPAISPDDLSLYFTSDMKGGLGGHDIWMVSRSSKSSEWGEPENLGEEINTPGEEMFPYVHSDGTLYFCSDTRLGMGGLDIFKAKKGEDGKWKVENMRYPINSSADDYGIIFEPNAEKGYLCSTRGTKGDDDIYYFYLPPLKFNLAGVVKDEKTEEVLPGAIVKSVSSDGITVESKTDKKGEFKFILKPGTDYVFIVTKEGFLNGKERETTKGLEKSKDFKSVVLLSPIDKPIELPNIFYDFAKWDLRPESMVSLDKLIETLNENPTITIELGSHTDSRGSDADNQILSQKRAQSVVDYLISKGIAADRLVAKGYGESIPKLVDKKLAQQYIFLPEGTVLDDAFIDKLPSSDLQEIAHQINRRTEFKVLSTSYIPKVR